MSFSEYRVFEPLAASKLRTIFADKSMSFVHGKEGAADILKLKKNRKVWIIEESLRVNSDSKQMVTLVAQGPLSLRVLCRRIG